MHEVSVKSAKAKECFCRCRWIPMPVQYRAEAHRLRGWRKWSAGRIRAQMLITIRENVFFSVVRCYILIQNFKLPVTNTFFPTQTQGRVYIAHTGRLTVCMHINLQRLGSPTYCHSTEEEFSTSYTAHSFILSAASPVAYRIDYTLVRRKFRLFGRRSFHDRACKSSVAVIVYEPMLQLRSERC